MANLQDGRRGGLNTVLRALAVCPRCAQHEVPSFDTIRRRRVEAAENGVLSLGEIFSNEAAVSDLDHLPEGPWAPSDAREAQRINEKSVTSPRQFLAR